MGGKYYYGDVEKLVKKNIKLEDKIKELEAKNKEMEKAIVKLVVRGVRENES